MALAPLSLFPLLLVCLGTGVRSCLQCDRTIRYMHEDFLSSVKGITVQDQMDLKGIIEHAYTTYQDTSMQLRGFSAEDGFEVVVVTEDSKIVLNQLSVGEQGVYRCLLLDKHGTELSRMYFMLTVTPLPASTTWPVPPLPPLPTLDFRPTRLHRDTLIIILALLTVLSISASLAILVGFSCSKTAKWQKKERTRKKQKEEI
ncbi:hypothetical protein SRHO_G00330110 [Serrasalmus rhombeus]